MTTAASTRWTKDIGSWVQVETFPMVGMSIRSGRSEDTLERSEEGLKPPSLLRQRHIRILLFIDGLYSVCFFSSVVPV